MRRLRLGLLLLALPACGDESDSWLSRTPAVVHRANGFAFRVYGPRDTGYAPDHFASLEAGLVTPEDVGLALESEARELAVRDGLDPELAAAALRRLEIRVVDDYSFAVQGRWAAGLYNGRIIVALWSRRQAVDSSEIPLSSPGWTIRAPDGGGPWRYGADPLVPAADHELGHHFFGPGYGH